MDNTRGSIHELHFNFLDLKRLYMIKDLETDNQEKTTVFLKAMCKIEHVQVYVKECQPEPSTNSFVGKFACEEDGQLFCVELCLS